MSNVYYLLMVHYSSSVSRFWFSDRESALKCRDLLESSDSVSSVSLLSVKLISYGNKKHVV